jgi:hypothetical protein
MLEHPVPREMTAGDIARTILGALGTTGLTAYAALTRVAPVHRGDTKCGSAVRDGTVRDDVDAGAVMMTLHDISAAHDRPDWRAEADDVITLVLDGLRRPETAKGPEG